jgi:Na+/proline symporter
MTAFFGLIQMGVALVTIAIQGDRSVVDQVLTVAGFTTGMILGLFFLGSMARPVRSRSALIGVVVGFLTVCLVWLPLEQGPDGKARSFLAWPWYAPVGSLTTLLVALLVDRLMPRTEERPSHGSP